MISVMDGVNKARVMFNIKQYPGILFDYLNEKFDLFDEFKILLLKENIYELSGFIGYYNDISVICVNYNRPIGHQNISLAHEIGHYILHPGCPVSDSLNSINGRDANSAIESEAFEFAQELIYPSEYFAKDYLNIKKRNLLEPTNRKELAIEIDKICNEYGISFEFVLRKILYKGKLGAEYKSINSEITKALGSTITKYFTSDLYLVDNTKPCYQRNLIPYEKMKAKIEKLVSEDKISKATGEAILFSNGLLGDELWDF